MERLLIKNGTVCDGNGGKDYKADILIENGLIEKIIINDPSKNKNDIEAFIIDAEGASVTPGFIDIHRHCDYTALKKEFGKIELAQGITSVFTGSCGLTPFPQNISYDAMFQEILEPCLGKNSTGSVFKNYSDYKAELVKAEHPLNIGNLIGAGAVRVAVKGFESTVFTKDEMLKAKIIIEEAMQEGAFGLSMGIMYIPEFYNTVDEMVELAKASAKYNGILTTHIRGEGDNLIASIKEVLEIAKRAEIPLQISHFKAAGKNNWKTGIHKCCDMIESARNSGVNVNVDFYPYHYGATTMMSLVPPSILKKPLSDTWSFMGTSAGLKEFRNAVAAFYPEWDNYALSLGWDKIIIASVEREEDLIYLGKNVTEIVAEFGFTNEYEFVCDLMNKESGKVGVLVSSMSCDDVDTIARLPYSFVISDALYNDTTHPHPRLCGSFAKIIRDFVCERNVLSFSEAIKKMTYMPARKMNLNKRGLIKEGNYADINIFRKENFKDNASLLNPRGIAEGMDYVLVNGQVEFHNREILNRNAGSIFTV